ncbi:MAG: glycosyltransferase family 2 protein [Oceanospirillaceae bacterium]|nr:glycosyltransferase family 2 protein [Oceanospirillaceae bacterium]
MDHLKRCIQALQANELASKTVVYIVSDAAKDESAAQKVKEIRSYIRSIQGFLDIVKIFPEHNLGSKTASFTAIKMAIEKHDKMIRMEDDVLVSPDFLSYMNDALEYYKNDMKVFSISSYSPSQFSRFGDPETVYFSQRFNPWGYGTWLDRWRMIDFTLQDFEDFCSNRQNRAKLNEIGSDVYALLKTYPGEEYPRDLAVCYNLIKNNMFTVYPFTSRSVNTGFDGSGEHSGRNMKIDSEILNKNANHYEFTPCKGATLEMLEPVRNYHTHGNEKLKLILHSIGVLNTLRKLRKRFE